MQLLTECHLNSHVNNLKDSKSKIVSGWTFHGVEAGPWNKNAEEWGCDNSSWGNVAVHLNGIRLSDVGPKIRKGCVL